jgi:hypothetical protein
MASNLSTSEVERTKKEVHPIITPKKAHPTSTKVLKTYTPLPSFPPISLSGGTCQLQCKHCDGTYLGGMLAAETPEALLAIGRKLHQRGAIGALLSGGSDAQGRLLNLKGMVEAIRQLKRETDLILNLHPGILDEETARELAVDFASLELPSDDVIRNVFGLPFGEDAYWATYAHLQASGIEVVPHICVYQGDEYKLLENLVKTGATEVERIHKKVHPTHMAAPGVIVVIVFSPTRNTPMANVCPPEPEAVAEVVTHIKAMFPKAEVALGCMRPRAPGLREEMESAALEAGVSRMVLPARATLQRAQAQGYEIRHFETCCALPVAYEKRAIKGMFS